MLCMLLSLNWKAIKKSNILSIIKEAKIFDFVSCFMQDPNVLDRKLKGETLRDLNNLLNKSTRYQTWH